MPIIKSILYEKHESKKQQENTVNIKIKSSQSIEYNNNTEMMGIQSDSEYIDNINVSSLPPRIPPPIATKK